MRPFQAHVWISAPREAVYEYVVDLAARIAWCDHYLRDFRLTTPRSSHQGAGARFHLDAPLNRTWAELVLAETERPSRIVEELRLGRLGRTPGWTVYDFVHHTRDVTRVEVTAWTEPATRVDAAKELFGTRRWLREQIKLALERLRMVFEERPDAPLARATIAGYEPAKGARFGSAWPAGPRHGVEG